MATTERAPRAQRPLRRGGRDAGQHATRERLLTAATELFAVRGYHGTGIAEVLQAAGVSRGSFYYFFGAKQDLLAEISLQPVLQMCRIAAEIHARPADAVTKVEQLAEALMSDIATNQQAWQVYYRDAMQLTGEQYAEVLSARDRFESYWRQIVDDGARAGELNEMSTVQLKGMLGMFNNAVFWFKNDGAMSPGEVSRQLVGLLLGGLRRS